jgi:hypothetical protein
MAEFPPTIEALNANGYKFKNSGRCNGPTCGAEIEWWITPNGKNILLDKGTLEPHWVSCPDFQNSIAEVNQNERSYFNWKTKKRTMSCEKFSITKSVAINASTYRQTGRFAEGF